MCKEMPVIPILSVVDKRRIIGKNRGPTRRRGTRGKRVYKKFYKFLFIAAWIDCFPIGEILPNLVTLGIKHLCNNATLTQSGQVKMSLTCPPGEKLLNCYLDFS
jgi:hypothetical protein